MLCGLLALVLPCILEKNSTKRCSPVHLVILYLFTFTQFVKIDERNYKHVFFSLLLNIVVKHFSLARRLTLDQSKLLEEFNLSICVTHSEHRANNPLKENSQHCRHHYPVVQLWFYRNIFFSSHNFFFCIKSSTSLQTVAKFCDVACSMFRMYTDSDIFTLFAICVDWEFTT